MLRKLLPSPQTTACRLTSFTVSLACSELARSATPLQATRQAQRIGDCLFVATALTSGVWRVCFVQNQAGGVVGVVPQVRHPLSSIAGLAPPHAHPTGCPGAWCVRTPCARCPIHATSHQANFSYPRYFTLAQKNDCAGHAWFEGISFAHGASNLETGCSPIKHDGNSYIFNSAPITVKYVPLALHGMQFGYPQCAVAPAARTCNGHWHADNADGRRSHWVG